MHHLVASSTSTVVCIDSADLHLAIIMPRTYESDPHLMNEVFTAMLQSQQACCLKAGRTRQESRILSLQSWQADIVPLSHQTSLN